MADDPRPPEPRVSDDVVVREIRIRARPETVWEFFVDPAKVMQWKGVAVDIDARAGGVRRIDIHGGRDIALGEHVLLEPHRRLIFTWGWEGDAQVPPGSSTVEVTLTPDGDDTVVRLEHRDLPGADQRAKHAMGWDHYLPRLAIAATGGDPGPDEMLMPAE
jgi:uncharacterized protein YndB with AHSA1/START domain